MEALRAKLTSFVTYDDGVEIRKKLRSFSIKNYVQKYSDSEHMGFLKRNSEMTIEPQHPQSCNHPYYYGMFTIITQHIMADTIEELFDKAIDIEKAEDTRRVNNYGRS